MADTTFYTGTVIKKEWLQDVNDFVYQFTANPDTILTDTNIGVDVQAYNANLNSLSSLTDEADKGIQFTGSGLDTYTLTNAGKDLLDDATASDQRTTLGLGSLATKSTVNNSNWSGTDLAITNGGTGASTVADARTNLGFSTIGIAFSAKNTAGQTLTSGTTTKIAFATEVIDTNAAFSSSKFTVPIAGLYNIHAQVVFADDTYVGGPAPSVIAIYKNGVEYQRGLFVSNATTNEHVSMQVTTLMNLAINDYVEVYVYHLYGEDVTTSSDGDVIFFGYGVG